MKDIDKIFKINEMNNWFKPKHISMYKDMVFRLAQESSAKRKKIGALIMSNHGSLFVGYNGRPPGKDNCCEDSDFKTLPDVIHAEMNCIMKMENENIDISDSIIFITDSPCEACCDVLISKGVGMVIYFRDYRLTDHLRRLEDNNIYCIKVTEELLEEIRLSTFIH